MFEFFNDQNANNAFHMMCAEELSKETKPEKKEKVTFDPIHNTVDLIVYVLVIAFVIIPLVIRYFG